MKIFKKCYVGVKVTDRNNNGTPLGYLVPYEDNAAGKQRMNTVDSWVTNKRYLYSDDGAEQVRVGLIFDNVPLTGFQITGWNSRYSTDNKTVRITDPRGFELEIYIPNLTDLIMNTTIIQGVIQEELIWARDGSNNFLIAANSKSYTDAWQEGNVLDPVVGDIVKDHRGTEYVYLGLKKITYHSTKKKEEILPDPNSWTPHRTKKVYTDLDEAIQFKLKKSMHVYLEVSKLDTEDSWEHGVIRAAKIKIQAISGKIDVLPDGGKKWNMGTYYHNNDGTAWGPQYDITTTPHYTKTVTFE